MKRILIVAVLLEVFLPTFTFAQETTSWRNDVFTTHDKKLQWGLSAGWVAKEWTTSIKGRTFHEDLWGNPDKMLHGLQFGFHLQQSLYNGIGWRTGLYYEWYISLDKYIKDQGFSRFNEHGLYLPLHVMIQMTPIKNVTIMPYGGFGFNWAIYGNLKSGPFFSERNRYYSNNLVGTVVYSIIDAATGSGNRREYPYEYFDYNNHTPHHWNVQAEVGVVLRIYGAELTFIYSWGLNRHWLYDDASSRQNKMAANVAFTI